MAGMSPKSQASPSSIAIQKRVSGLGLHALSTAEEILSKCFQASAVQVAYHNHSSRIVGECLAITPQHFGKLVWQEMRACIGTAREILGNAAYAFICSHLKGVLCVDDSGAEDVERLLARPVFNQYFKVHPLTSDQDSRCTRGRPAAVPPQPGCLQSTLRWPGG